MLILDLIIWIDVVFLVFSLYVRSHLVEMLGSTNLRYVCD